MRRWILAAALLAGTTLTGFAEPDPSHSALPDRLSDAEFWDLVETFSEGGGEFESDNLVSNEDRLQWVIPHLVHAAPEGGAYIGVGPDQNFTYIAALEPEIAFVVDIRRGNLLEHLMYKAIIELSEDRADFLAWLFSRPRPAGVDTTGGAHGLFAAYAAVAPDERRYRANLRVIQRWLVQEQGFLLAPGDLDGLAAIYRRFFEAGPALTYAGVAAGGWSRFPSYQSLHTATDRAGVAHGYLSSESRFRVLKTYQEQNLIIPIVGNFAGPKTLRAIAGYLRERHATVSVFYTSNVEQYLFEDRAWGGFADNVAGLPLEDGSTFVRSCFHSCGRSDGARSTMLVGSIPALLAEASGGRVTTYWDVLGHSTASH